MKRFDLNKMKSDGQLTTREALELAESLSKLGDGVFNATYADNLAKSLEKLNDQLGHTGPPHRTLDAECQCVRCTISRLGQALESMQEFSEVVKSLGRIEHDLAEDCPCLQCVAVRGIKARYA